MGKLNVKILFIYVFLLINFNLFAVQVDILQQLQALPGVVVVEVETTDGFQRTFQIDLTQPVDHNNPSGQQFTQRIYLNHNDVSSPMILLTSGYSASRTSIQEVARKYHTNHLAVTRRYMNGSIPDPVDWQYLTIEQSAADHHNIVTLFKQTYSGVWISSGRSLSGLTALCHRRFYPDDVIGTLAYSTPLMFSTSDSRFEQFLNEVGDQNSRDIIKRFQRSILENRNDILPLFTQYLINLGLGYSLGDEVILEYIVLEYPFYFWAFGSGNVSVIPDTNATATELLDALLNVVDGFEYTDFGNDYFKSVYYQLYTEVGYYGLITEHLQDLLVAVSNPSHLIFAPNYQNISFNPEVMQDLNLWLQSYGNDIIYLYGDQDSWSAAAVEVGNQTNAIKLVQSGQNHFLRISDLDDSVLVYNKIDEWFGVSNIDNVYNHPISFKLNQNFPNPFNPTTKISYSIPQESFISLKIYDVLGNEIQTLIDEEKSAGNYIVEFDGTGLSNGIYFYKLRSGDFIGTKKMILLK